MEWGKWRVSSVKKTHRHTHTSREVCFACRRCDLVLLLLLTVQASKPAAQHLAELIMEVPYGTSRGRCCPKLLLIFNIRSHRRSPLRVRGSRTSCTEDAAYGGLDGTNQTLTATTPVWEPQSVGAGRRGRVGG